MFLQFNKIRAISHGLKPILKALKHSESLELNEEKTKVRRKTPFVEPSQKDTDKRTIYVVCTLIHIIKDQ